jgi:hypothetical protein
MYDEFLTEELLRRIEISLKEIIDWTVNVKSVKVFDTLKEDIPPLLEVIKQMKNDCHLHND